MDSSPSQSKNEAKPESGGSGSLSGDEICDMSSSVFRDLTYKRAQAWIETLDPEDTATRHPPHYIVLHADLVKSGWGWKRLVPCNLRYVALPDLKTYFVNYYKNNDTEIKKLICKKPVGQPDKEAVVHDDLIAAINKCMDTENTLVRTCITDFDLDGLILSGHIKEHLNQLLQSGCESSAAAAALLCITKENELILDVSNRDFDVKEDISFANVVRRCASAFLLYKGSEYDSDAAAGVMLGMAKEADLMTHSSDGEHCYASVDYVICEKIRKRAVESLVVLEKELVSKTDADGSPVGYDLHRICYSGEL